jgi:hypothetical protein
VVAAIYGIKATDIIKTNGSKKWDKTDNDQM